MKISKLVVENMKGQSFEQSLSGRDVFIGRNGIGKTTRLESLIFGIMGYIPTRGKQLSDSFSLSSGNEMKVTLYTDTDLTCSRMIKQKKTKKRNGEKSYSLTKEATIIPLKGEKTKKEIDKRILTELGDFSMMFDIDEFFNLSNDLRRKFIFDMIDPENYGWNKETVFTYIYEHIPANNYIEDALQVWDDDIDININISNIIDSLKDTISSLKIEHKSSKAAVRELMTQKNNYNTSQKSSAEIKKELDDAINSHRNISSQIGENSAKLNRRNSILNEINKLESKLNKENIISDGLDTNHESMEQKKKELIDINHSIKSVKADKIILEKEYNDIKDKLSVLNTEYTIADEKRKQQISLLKDIDFTCPILLEKCTSIDRLEEKKESLDLEISALEKTIKDLNIQNNTMNDYLIDKNNRIKSLNEKENSILIKIETLTNEIHQCELNYIKQKNIINEQAEYENNINVLKKELINLNIIDTDHLNVSIAGIEEKMNSLREELREQDKIKTLTVTLNNSIIKSDELEETIDLIDDIIIQLGPRNLQGDIINSTVKPVIDNINYFLNYDSTGYQLSIILEDKNGNCIFDLIWKKEDKIITFESLSGGEKVIFSAAFICSLLNNKQIPVKTLCIEAAEVDNNNLTLLLNAINNFGKSIDNVLIATHVIIDDVEGWKIHHL